MDSKKLEDIISKVTEYLDNEVQEGIPVIRFIDDSMDAPGVKIEHNLLIQEIDGDLMLERIIEIPATKFDPGDIIFEEICVVSSVEELLPAIKMALEENEEERTMSAWMDYENDIDVEVEEEDDDDF